MLAAKLKHDEVRASAYLRYRENLEMMNGKRPTETEVDSNVVTDQQVREAKSEIVESEFEREKIRAVVDALRAKRENLTSLVLLARAELAGTHGFREPARDA
jgi:anthranilate phosphoribosyltransferase